MRVRAGAAASPKRRIAMPTYERGPVRISYEEMGSGPPLPASPGGGLDSTIAGLDTSHPVNAMKVSVHLAAHRARGRRID
jgi:hypothetical protein